MGGEREKDGEVERHIDRDMGGGGVAKPVPRLA